MLETLERGREVRAGRAGKRHTNCGAYVVAVFVSGIRIERECIRLYAQTHGDIHVAAILRSGRELIEQLRRGLSPQVIVLDSLLEGNVLALMEEIRALHLDPEPSLLLTVPLPERMAVCSALRTLENCQILLKPYRMRDLFDQVYLLGAGSDQYRLYRARNCCRHYLQQLRADPAMSGCDYLEQMLLYALTAERPLPIAVLYQFVAQENDTQEGNVAAAVTRLSRKMQRQATPLYRDLCRRCGLKEDAALPNGKLLKALLEMVRQDAAW